MDAINHHFNFSWLQLEMLADKLHEKGYYENETIVRKMMTDLDALHHDYANLLQEGV